MTELKFGNRDVVLVGLHWDHPRQQEIELLYYSWELNIWISLLLIIHSKLLCLTEPDFWALFTIQETAGDAASQWPRHPPSQ